MNKQEYCEKKHLEIIDAFEQGYSTALHGSTIDSKRPKPQNPFVSYTDLWLEWEHGYNTFLFFEKHWEQQEKER